MSKTDPRKFSNQNSLTKERLKIIQVETQYLLGDEALGSPAEIPVGGPDQPSTMCNLRVDDATP